MKRACLLSYSPVADDPRVRRQGDCLTEAGWQVRAVGFAPRLAAPPQWPVEAVAPPKTGLAAGLLRVLRGLLARLAPQFAYWLDPATRALWRRASGIDADLIIANDWPVLPIASRLAARSGGAILYDSHEYAADERAAAFRWRLLIGPLAASIERLYIPRVDAVCTVSEGIARRLQSDHALAVNPTVIRNVPGYVSDDALVRNNRSEEFVTVLYQGLFNADRGLQALIASVASWRPEFRLVLRGLGAPREIRRLRRVIAASPEKDRIELAPPVPADRLIAAAAEADIGIFLLDGHGVQREYVLPNKIFEYMMAGLAVCSIDLPEIRRVLAETGAGRLIRESDAAAIAAAVNGFDKSSLARHRAAARAAAGTFNWNNESRAFLELCDALTQARKGR